MFWPFFKYFFAYILKAKTRQHLLFLSLVGLFVSSFALLFLQSTMGGLQKKLKSRSKNAKGYYTVYLKTPEQTENVFKILNEHGVKYSKEYELELLGRYGNKLSPLIVHGIDFDSFLPPFLKKQENSRDMLIPVDLARRLSLDYGDELTLISPSHTNDFFGEIPRTISVTAADSVVTEVPEVDSSNVWISLKSIQNLARSKNINRLRIYSQLDESIFEKIKSSLPEGTYIQTWEDENSSLVWALQLETIVVIMLFVGMCLLVSLCIVSGIFIFLNKIQIDLSTFWILGASVSQIKKHVILFVLSTSQISILFGILISVIALILFDKYGGEIMPHEFVDRKIPVYITSVGIILSYVIPTFISTLFTLFSFGQFAKRKKFAESIRMF